jgi:hypothetical protein
LKQLGQELGRLLLLRGHGEETAVAGLFQVGIEGADIREGLADLPGGVLAHDAERVEEQADPLEHVLVLAVGLFGYGPRVVAHQLVLPVEEDQVFPTLH